MKRHKQLWERICAFEKQLELTRLTAVIRKLEENPVHFVETSNLTPMAFPLWADRLSATYVPADAASRLEAMLVALNQAAK